LALTLSACNEAIHNYAAGTHPPASVPTPSPRKPDVVPNGPSQILLTPGGVRSSAVGLSMDAAVNSEQRDYAVGTDRRARIAIGWSQSSL